MTETARMYGGSLYDLAAEEGLETRILGELDEAVALFRNSILYPAPERSVPDHCIVPATSASAL